MILQLWLPDFWAEMILPTTWNGQKIKNRFRPLPMQNFLQQEQVPGDVQEEIQISEEAETCAEPQVVLDKTAEEETKEAIRAAIDQLASNPQELFELINQIVKRTN